METYGLLNAIRAIVPRNHLSIATEYVGFELHSILQTLFSVAVFKSGTHSINLL